MAVRILHGPATSGKKNVVTILISISLSISAVSRAGQHNSNAFESESESGSGSESESFPLGFAEKSSCLLRGLHSGSWHGAVDRSRVRWGSRSPVPRPWALRCAVPAVNCPNVRKDAAVGRFAARCRPSTAQTCGRTPRLGASRCSGCSESPARVGVFERLGISPLPGVSIDRPARQIRA